MFSQCPDCQAIFQVSDAHLKAANGNVRCGQCLTIFDARENRRDDLLDNDPAEQSAEFPGEENPVAHETAMGVEDELEYSVYIEHFDNDAAETTASDDDLDELTIDADEVDGTPKVRSSSPQTGDQAGGAARDKRKRRRRGESQKVDIPTAILEQLEAEKAEQLRPSRAPWVIGNLLLILVLLGQGAYFARHELARDPQWRPWLEQACALIRCEIARPYDLRLVEIVNRDVRTDPALPQALIASTTLINSADFTQPFPLLNLHFSDINGNRLAQRRFTPEEYLPTGLSVSEGMPPNRPVVIELKLKDPGEAAVNFEFITEADPRQGLHSG